MSLPLKLAVLLAISLALFNGQCIANCMAFPCQSQDDSNLPPCHQHRHHTQQSQACAQPATANNATAPVESLLFLTARPFAPIGFAVDPLQAREHHSPPDLPPPVPLTLRI